MGPFIALALASLLALLGGATGAAASAAPAFAGAATGTIEPGAKGVIGLGDTGAGPHAGGVMYDSRKGAALAAKETRALDVLRGWVPASASAVILTVTAVDMRSSGWLTVWGGSASRPTASTLNFAPGTPVPNTAVVTLGTSRSLWVMNGSGASTHVLLSFQGYVLEDGTEVRPGSLRPTKGIRVVDTRTSSKPVPAKGYRDIVMPASAAPAGSSAAVLDVVAVKPTRAGYLIAHAPDTTRPNTTSLTYRVGGDRAALTVVPLSRDGRVRVWNMSSAPVHLVVDSFGWVASGAGGTTLAGLDVGAPTRVLDTRLTSAGAVVAGAPRAIPRAGVRGSGMLLSITVTGATTAGYLRYRTTGPDGLHASPSFINFAAGQTLTTSVFVPLPWRESSNVFVDAVMSGSVHVVVDRLAVVGERAQVVGTVTDSLTGAPVEGANVSTTSEFITQTVSAADGAYRVAPMDLASVAVCARTGTDEGEGFALDGRYTTGCARGPASDPAGLAPIALPLGARLADEDVALAPNGVLKGKVVGPDGMPDVYGVVSVERVDGGGATSVRFGEDGTNPDGSWQVSLVPGTYIVSTSWGARKGSTSPYLANEVATGLPRIPRSGELATTPAQLVAAGASTFTVVGGSSATVPTLSLLDPGRLVPTVVDPDGDLSDVSIVYVHADSGLRVWGYPVGSPASSIRASIPLRPGAYAVCVTEGATSVCNDGSASAGAAHPVDVVSGQNTSVTLTLP